MNKMVFLILFCFACTAAAGIQVAQAQPAPMSDQRGEPAPATPEAQPAAPAKPAAATPAPAKPAPTPSDRAKKPAKETKPEVPVPFWKAKLPEVKGKIERRYDLNRDGILQTAETKIFLRDVSEEIEEKKSYNIGDSALLKTYDKNKDGIISRLELEDIKKDLKEE